MNTDLLLIYFCILKTTSMFLLNLSFSLPLSNPVLIFAVILAIILFAPILLNRIKIPHLSSIINDIYKRILNKNQ